MMIELLLPSTDAGVAVQLGALLALGATTVVLVRRSRHWQVLAVGITCVALGLMGVRAVH